MTDHVKIARDGAVVTATLARPDKKNALTGAMYDVLRETLEQADADASVGAVLLAGEGGAFTAGNDIADFLAGGARPALRFVRTIAACKKPVVAVVEGVAVGVGTTLLFHCDLVYAAPSAMFKMPFIDLALVPEAAATYTVPARFGLAKANEMLLLGEAIDAQEAHRLGLVNAVVDAPALRSHALEKARRLAAKPRAALAASRRMIRGDGETIMARIDEEALAFEAALRSDEARAAFMAFMSKGKA